MGAFMRQHTEHFLALAPVNYLSHMSGVHIQILSSLESMLVPASLAGIFVLRDGECAGKDGFNEFDELYAKITRAIFNHRAGSVTLKQIKHYLQLMNSDTEYFGKYDKKGEWSFADWTTPTTLIGGTKDEFSSDETKKFLMKQFPKSLDVKM